MTYHVEDPPKEAAAKERKRPEVDRLLRQFLKIETGLGNSPEFQRGWVWNFEWCSEDPKKARPELVSFVQARMSEGLSFEDAFDEVARFDVCEHEIVVDEKCGDCGATRLLMVR